MSREQERRPIHRAIPGIERRGRLVAVTSAALASAYLAAIASAQPAEPPVAAARPVELERHGDVRVDPYFWLRERDDPEVLAYLEAENAYYERKMEPLRELEEELFQEIVGRIDENDASVPYRLGDHLYYHRFEEGKQYPIHARKAATQAAPEQILLDVNTLAEGHAYYDVRHSAESISPSGRYLAWAADTTGRRFYTIRILDMKTGTMLADAIPKVTGNLVWAEDDRTLFYAKQDPETLRSYRIYRHILGADPSGDVLVYEEDDETFDTSVAKAKDDAYLFIVSDQTLATEYRTLAANDPTGSFEVFEPRRRGHEYHLEHAGDHFYVRTNGEAENFRLMRRPDDAAAGTPWEEVIPHREDVFLAGFETFRDFLVADEREEGLARLRIRLWADPEAEHYVAFEEAAYAVSLGHNPSFDSGLLRYVYESPTTPETTYDYDVAARQSILLKREAVHGGFDPADYRTERLSAPARDGARVPVTLVFRKKGHARDGSSPLLLHGYGSYGSSIQPSFDASRVSLLDRGFAFAIAHVRGSQTLGRRWYEEGKLLAKRNTFTDFIDVGEHLAEEGYADRDRLYATGRSAGGLLMGAVMNMRPDLFHGVIAHVPWVDVVTTMLDDSVPLTTSEYDEWGDPNDPEYYATMLSYSPYDNVEAKTYPHLLVTTSLHDSQVQYWEPAKWVAKLRAMKTDDNLLLLHTDMEAGHGGASGRYDRYRETARDYAFLLHLAGERSADPPQARGSSQR